MKKTNPNRLTDQEILDILREEYYVVQPTGCHDFFKRKKLSPCLPYLRNRFGMSFNEILIKAGIPKEELNFVRCKVKEKEYYINTLQEVAMEIGHTPTANEYKNKGYSAHELNLVFGSYNEALREANLKPNKEPAKNVSKRALLNIYKEISEKVNRPATLNDLNKHAKFYSLTLNNFILVFGSLNELRKQAGFEVKGRKPIYSKEDIVQALIMEYKKYQRHLTAKEIDQNKSLPSRNTIMRMFKVSSLKKVWAEIDRILAQQNINGETQNEKKKRQQSYVKKSGDYGEKRVAHQLSFLDQKKYRVYNDVKICFGNLVQQFDHIVIGESGIFHLETKNYKGTISIDRHGNWERVNGGTLETIECPEAQIIRHEELLYQVIGTDYDVVSMLVYAHPKCSLKNMDRTKLNVVKAEQAVSFIKYYQDTPKLNSNEIKYLCKLIERHIVKEFNTAI
ncbi:homing endonuclease associated repeat-containing protein [Alkalihalobacterium bogoriense]|uniref:homing endonuclease associated repeat-containing protein n=1 Tax=Alkalihalobacterium bogoriense TaxID=246272 RepID=UPI00047E9DB6|nr:NERD domain-containing protein [Alkalihalobacterium bogoriense]